MNKYRLMMVCAAMLVASSCGNRKVARNTPTSKSSVELPSTEEPTNKPLLECVNLQGGFITAKISTFYDAFLQIRHEAVRMQISKLTTDFDANRGHYLQVFRWKATQSTSAIDPNPLTVRYESRNLPGQVLTGNYDHVSHATAIAMANDNNLPGNTVQSVLQNLTMVITGLTSEDDALKIVVYNDDDQAVAEADVLIPGFHINPDHYSDDNGSPRAQALMDLHPYISSLGADQDASLYESLSQQSRNCFNPLF